MKHSYMKSIIVKLFFNNPFDFNFIFFKMF